MKTEIRYLTRLVITGQFKQLHVAFVFNFKRIV